MSTRVLFWVVMLITFVTIDTYAQKQGNIWHFGQNAGLDFNSGSPVPIDGSQMNTHEGCASIADEDGNLLFYTDGIKVWDASHSQMPNGFGMTGDPSSTQSGVIVPKPGDPDIYYIFTVDARIGRLDYSTVDMSMNGGLGDVVTKNFPLLAQSTEKISAVYHENGLDIWVLGHEMHNDKFYAWLITGSGVNSTPVVTSAGSPHVGYGNEAIGYLKFSPNDKKVVAAGFSSLDFVEVFDFNSATGTVSFESRYDRFSYVAEGPYGVEFSPDSKNLYIAERAGFTYLYQVPVGTPSGRISEVATWSYRGYNFGALQLASDGKIYLARDDVNYLGVINQPDAVGDDIDFELDGVWLGSNQSTIGLPTFIQSFFRIPNFEASNLCSGESAQFTIDPADLEDFDSLFWDFGEPTSGILNNSTNPSPTHRYANVGTYDVTLVGYINGTGITRTLPLEVHALSEFDLGADQVLISDESADLSAPQNGDTYLWNDGSDEAARSISSPGWHWLDGTNAFNCTTRDSIAIFNVSYADTCFASATRFSVQAGDIDIDSVSWTFDDPVSGTDNTSSLMEPNHLFSAAGDYEIGLNLFYNGQQTNRDFTITINELPDAGLPNAMVLVNGVTQTLNTGNLTTSWDNGSTEHTRTLNSPGWRWADLTNDISCSTRDSVAVFTISYADTCFNANTQFNIETGNINLDSISWDLGDTQANTNNFRTTSSFDHTFSAPGTYDITAHLYFQGQTHRTSFTLEIPALPQLDLGPERTLFYGETESLSVAGAGSSYLWQDGSTEDNILVEGPGIYWVEVVNEAGCSFRDSVLINYDQIIDVSLSADTLLCPDAILPLDVTLPGATYSWQDGSTHATYEVRSPGTYWVDITNAYQNRSLRDSIVVEYYSFNDIQLEEQHVICATQSLELIANGAKAGEIYRWYDQAMNLIEENSGTFLTPEISANTNYFVTLTNGRCETEPLGISIIHDEVNAVIEHSESIVGFGEAVYLEGFGGETFAWSPPTWLNQTEGPSVIANPEEDIEYTLTVTGAWGCRDSTSVEIQVERALYVPEAFTPNGDGFNDTFEIKNIERFPNNIVEIWNRLNKRIFSFEGYKNEWDGTLNGVDLFGNTFVYVIYRFKGDQFPVRGTIRILR